MGANLAPRILVDNELATITVDDEGGIVTFSRKSSPMDLESLDRMLISLDELLPLDQRAQMALLFDMRKAPPGQPEQGPRILRFAEAFQKGFVASASVFSTADGRAQASRARREGHLEGSEAMSSLEGARRYLEGRLDDALSAEPQSAPDSTSG
jgi:hypothetical protein